MSDMFGQPFNGFPRLDTAFVDLSNGYIVRPWQRFLLSLWQKTGGSNSSLPGAYYLNATPDGQIGIYQTLTGKLVGVLNPVNPQPPEVLTLTSNPFVWTPKVPGTLIVFGGKLQIERATATLYDIGLTGGCVPMLHGDSVTISWFGPDAPPSVWLASQ